MIYVNILKSKYDNYVRSNVLMEFVPMINALLPFKLHWQILFLKCFHFHPIKYVYLYWLIHYLSIELKRRNVFISSTNNRNHNNWLRAIGRTNTARFFQNQHFNYQIGQNIYLLLKLVMYSQWKNT